MKVQRHKSFTEDERTVERDEMQTDTQDTNLKEVPCDSHISCVPNADSMTQIICDSMDMKGGMLCRKMDFKNP